MKAELCILGTLILLSSITGIFNNLVVVKDASAQQVQKAFTQCLKCADLAIIQSGGQAQQAISSDALIGTPTNNIFTTCASDTPQTGFNATIDATSLSGGPNGQKATVKNAFAECLTNAPDSAAAQMESLQDTSITTTVQAEPEIPSVNTLLENPHVKALLENPDLNALLENPDVKALLEDPNVNALLEDPTMNTLLENPHFKSLLQAPELNALLEDPDVKALLEDPDVNALLQYPTIDPPSGLFPSPSGLFQ